MAQAPSGAAGTGNGGVLTRGSGVDGELLSLGMQGLGGADAAVASAAASATIPDLVVTCRAGPHTPDTAARRRRPFSSRNTCRVTRTHLWSL